MKLILSSCDFINKLSKKTILDNIDKPLEECKVLFIPNEKATKEKLESNKYYDRLFRDGFINKENIYIFNQYEPDKYRNLNIDLLYVSGGNTFATLDKIRKCNFDKDIINYVKNGVTYIGGSCGAQIVTKNIKHIEDLDENYVNLTDYNGLGLFDGILVVHYDVTRKSLVNSLLNTSKYKVYTLRNDESLVVDDNDIKKI